jgi:peptide/nickel transport system substrate-binding protein
VRRTLRWPAAALFLVTVFGCKAVAPLESVPPADAVLRVGFGGFSGGSQSVGINSIIQNIVEERLINVGRDGRLVPSVIDRWSASADRRTWQLHVRDDVRFHDGTPVTAEIVRDILTAQMPAYLGPDAHNVADIQAVGADRVSVVLNQPSNFFLESLEIPVERRGPGREPLGTAPFQLSSRDANEVHLSRNASYPGGAPQIAEIVVKQYGSLRAAWADMLRGQVDMLYEVGVDAQEFLEDSTQTRVFVYQRHYANMVLLNTRRPQLRDASIRRALNAAIDRASLVSAVLNGHGTPADGPLWPFHWAYDEAAPRFAYEPRAVDPPIEFTCLIADSSMEHLAMAVQQQLQEIGVTMHLQLGTLTEAFGRLQSGDFDAVLADAVSGPNLLRPYQFWYTNASNNYGKFSSKAVDAAFEAIDRAPDDVAYKSGVAALQRAIVDDPPAIFLAWGERARAVSTRFDVPVEEGRDILGTLRLWRPLAPPKVISTN